MTDERETMLVPFQKVTKVSLESTIQQVIDSIKPANEAGEKDWVKIPSDKVPLIIRRCLMKELIYLDGDVKAITTKAYLNSQPKDKKLSYLFQEPGNRFYLIDPRVIVHGEDAET